MTRKLRSGTLALLPLLLIISLSKLSSAAQPKVERIGPIAPTLVAPEVVAVLDKSGYRVMLDDGWSAELWLARELALTTKDVPGALYPSLSNGEFVGVIRLPKGMSDFRGQTIPPGTYTLRYQYLPQDANHMGVSPNPDFLLAIPAANDASPGTKYLFRKLVSLSSAVTGSHPAVIAMEAAGALDTAVFDEQKWLVMTVQANGPSDSKPARLGIVLKGQASQ